MASAGARLERQQRRDSRALDRKLRAEREAERKALMRDAVDRSIEVASRPLRLRR